MLETENFLRGKFGNDFDVYCKKVNRWVPDFRGLGKTMKGMEFKWKRWILKEHTTQYIWLAGIILILLLRYPELTCNNTACRNTTGIILLSALTLIYILIRVLKKTGKFKE
jgi:hypothetical protein